MKTAHLIPARLWAAGRTIGDPHQSPDGKSIAFVSATGAETHLVVFAEGCAEASLPCEPAVKRASPSNGGVIDWLPDGTGLVYLGVDSNLHIIDLDTFACRPITTWPAPISSVSVSPTGNEVAYVIDMADVAIVELKGGWPRRISSGADFAFDPVWSPDGIWLAWHEWDVPNMPWDASRIVARHSDGSGPIVTVAAGDALSVAQPRFSPDGKLLAFLSDANGWMNLWAIDVPGLDNPRVIVEEEHDLASPAWGPGSRSYCWSPDSASVFINSNERGRGRLYSVDLATKNRRLLGEGFHAGLGARDQALVSIRTSWNCGPTLVSIGTAAEDSPSRVLANGPVAGLDQAVVDPEDVEWTSDDGTVIPGRLYRGQRESDAPSPLLIWIHGGPHGQSPVTLYGRFGYFLQRGWSVLVPDYRGSSGWGRAHMQALNGRWGEVDVADVISGMTAAISNGWGSQGALVPFGGSAGGFTALHVLATRPDLCAAGVAMYPIGDLYGFSEETWRFEEHYMERLIGPLPQNYDEYVERSPLRHVDRITAPLLLLHGDSDKVVPVGQSRAIAERIERHGGTVECHIYEGEGHGWRKPETTADELRRVNDFLNRHVLHTSPRAGDRL